MTGKVLGQVSQWWILGVLICLAIAAIVAATVLLRNSSTEITSFQTCRDAGGAILESYPERCMIDGKSFTNEEQSVNVYVGDYIGLEEQAALDKAASEKKPARVVERDGDSLAVTMDLIPGRLNFSVKDGKVNSVQVEGVAEDGR